MEAKEILEALDLGDVTSREHLMELHNKKFLPLATAHEHEEVRSKATGKLLGSLTTYIKKEYDLSPDEIKDKKLEDVILLGSTKLKTKISELEAGSKKGKDEAVIELEAKLDKLKKDSESYKTAAEQAAKALQEKEGSFEKEKKGWKITSLYDGLKKEFERELISDIDPLKRKGFDSEINEKYLFDLDEDGKELAVYDKEGKRVPDPKKLGAFITPKDLLISEAAKAKLLKMNDGQTAKKVIGSAQTAASTTTNNKKSNIDPDNLPLSVRKRMGL
jgi:hypothetical protein